MEKINNFAVEGEDETLFWDLKNTKSLGSVSSSAANSSTSSVTAMISQTDGGAVEQWGQRKVLLTRFFGTNYPFITLTATSKIKLRGMSFNHYHNHNKGFPSFPSYKVGLQLETQNGWINIGSSFVASTETHGNFAMIELGGCVLGAGTYNIRWVPLDLTSGANIDSEFFGIDSIRLDITVLIDPCLETLYWDLENVQSDGPISFSVSNSSITSVSGVISQTGGGPAEEWDKNKVFLTRFFGNKNYPFITISTTSAVKLSGLSFNHYHNHNKGYPSYPNYKVKLQIDGGDGWKDIGPAFLASSETYGKYIMIELGEKLLAAGTYNIRWVPFNLSHGVDTNTEFFAINSIRLDYILVKKSGIDDTLFWDLENIKSTNSVSTSVANSSVSSIIGSISQTGGGPAEKWESGMVFLTRFFGTNFPFITFCTKSSVRLTSLSFNHYHNHNKGFPSYPSYKVGLQIHTGDDWTDIGSTFIASPETYGKTTMIDLGGKALAEGTYLIRWVPLNLAHGSNTNSEFFAVDSIRLDLTVFEVPEAKLQISGEEESLTWDLKNIKNIGSISTSAANSSTNSVMGILSETGGGPAEKWDQRMVFMTRFFGTNYPFIIFSVTSKIKLLDLSFSHHHNHNHGFPSHPNYKVGLQIDAANGWKDIGSVFTASPETNGQLTNIELGGPVLPAGTYQIRWIPIKLARGSDTNTEYFAIESVTLKFREILE